MSEKRSLRIQLLPKEILLYILQEVYLSGLSLIEFAYLRTVCHTFDDLVSCIVFGQANRYNCVIRQVPVKPPAIKWMLLTKTKIQRNDTRGLFAIIHETSEFLTNHLHSWGFNQSSSYEEYLNAACDAVIAQNGANWVLSTQLFGKKSRPNPLKEAFISSSLSIDNENTTKPKSLHTAIIISKGALHLAASLGNVAAVEAMLASGVDPNLKHPIYGYALIAAAYSGNVQVVKLLLDYEADPGVKNRDDATPLSIAASRNRKKVVDLLITDIRADPGTYHRQGQTALLWAVRRGWTDIVQALLAREGANADSRTPFVDFPLASAVANDNVSMVRLLLERDEVRIASDRPSFSPMCLAVEKGSPGMVKLLMERFCTAKEGCNEKLNISALLVQAIKKDRANIVEAILSREGFAIDSWAGDQPPLEVAVSVGNAVVVKMLLNVPGINPNTHRQLITPLGEAARGGRVDLVRLLLAHPDIDPDRADSFGLTPLYMAIRHEQTEVVAELLKRKDINVNQPIKRGSRFNPPLLLAHRQRTLNIIRMLLAREDIHVNQCGTEGTILFAAAESQNIKLLKSLLQRSDIDINRVCQIQATQQVLHISRDPDRPRWRWFWDWGIATRETAIMRAVKRDNLLVVKLLLQDKRTDPNVVDQCGRSLLWWAARNGHIQMVHDILLNGKTNVNMRDKHGWTALLCAVCNNHHVITQLLLDHPDIDPNLANKDGWTALHICAERGSKKILRQLIEHPRIDIWARKRDGKTATEVAQTQYQEVAWLAKAPSSSVDPCATS